ncbi:DUF2958 domain-containing protein [Bradyrhizobium sp. 2S1]|uniref:DUF2958 domain-containing protein n=1 Tax=Bradyrhizobium sp. 2S1 TaxID=1404429 RepID=UPI00140C0A42|nr:DUF2958 domain-containing protein [Bradyrhizobium sp. 2S1]MCK7664537.1 DUF2958 domain-containing protein [Bradyrhizobium sp. 2S1]
MQKLLLNEQRAQLLANGRANAERIAQDGNTIDHKPVVKLFTPWGGCTWLLSELDPENPDIAFGLCDLGMGCPELGNVSLSEIMSVRGPGGLTIERDEGFAAAHTMTHYADEALHSLP